MFRVTRIFTRLDTGIKWHFEVLDGSYFRETYIDTGKILLLNNTISEDGLTFNHEAFWIDEATWIAHKEDPNIIQYFAARDSYNNANGITASATTTETIGE